MNKDADDGAKDKMRVVLRGVAATVVLLVLVAGAGVYLQPLWVNDQRIREHLWRQHVKSEEVQVDGYTIHYFEAGPAGGVSGIPLVLVHGLGSRGEDWSGMIPTLAAEGFHVYAPDLLGYGRSSKPDVDYSIELEEKTVADFMEAVHLDHADVGGWSMGGWVALKLTMDHPERVDRLVVYDSAGLYFPATFDGSLFTPTDSEGMSRLTAMLTPTPKPLPGYVRRAAIRKLQANAWVIERSLAAMTAGKDLLDFELQEIHKPTLIVWGKEDRLIPVSVGQTMHRQIEGSSLLLVEGCGHLAPAECTGPVLRGTVGFLRAEPPERGGEKTVAR